MAAKTRAELKQYFETNDIPTEAQFAELIDNLAHITDGYSFQGALAYDDTVTTPERNVFYIAEISSVPRDFDDCGGITVNANELAILKYTKATATWTKETVGTVSGSQITTYAIAGGYTYTKIAGTKLVQVICIGAGGGGGSGARGAAGTNRSGGAGGAGGNYASKIFDASFLNTETSVIVGTGGGGGAKVLVDSTNGNPGNAGEESSFGIHLAASGGDGGPGGLNGSNPAEANPGDIYIEEQGAKSQVGAYAAMPGLNSRQASGSGASGAGITTANVAQNGATGGGARYCTNDPLSGGDAGLSAGTIDGQNGEFNDDIEWYGGAGGGSGASSVTQKSGSGGNGGAFGGGGGGGAASVNGYDSGAGGSGASGLVVVIAIF